MTSPDDLDAAYALATRLVAHAVATRRTPDVRWFCAAGQSGGRGGCLMLRAWKVDHPMRAVVSIPADRRAGNSQILTHNVRAKALALPLDEWRIWRGEEWANPLPAIVFCNHYLLTRPVADLLDDLAKTRPQTRLLSDADSPSDVQLTVVQRKVR